MNSVAYLDISSSTSSGLTRNTNDANKLSLAKEAIKMCFSRMNRNDSFGLVVFNDMAETLLPVQNENLNQLTENILNYLRH